MKAKKVTLTDGSYARYDYDAAGRKLKSYYHIGEDIVVGPGLDPVPFPSGLSGGDGLMSVGGEAQIAYLRDSIEYCGNVLYDNGHLDKVFVDGGYATLNATTGLPTFHFYVRDHLGSIRRIVRQDGVVERTNHYYPYGGLHGESTGTTSHRFRFSGKEYDPMLGLNSYDFSARWQMPDLTRFGQMDPLAEKTPDVSPYAYCHNNPIIKVDYDGKWDVYIHVMKDRTVSGLGIAVVKDMKGAEIYRFEILAEGVGGHNTMNENSDTPLGVYDIPEDSPWISGGNRASYGPNPRLIMVPESGDIVKSQRSEIRIHGGRQEIYNEKEKEWVKVNNPQLKRTKGCIRAYDDDMKAFKDIIEQLDDADLPGKVYVIDDLEEFKKEDDWHE